MIVRTLMVSVVALLLGACASTQGGQYYGNRGYGPVDGYAYCQQCGEVERIDRVYGQPQASGGGAIAGALIGGILGNQVGSGSGRQAAAVAGAVAGGVTGHRIERNTSAAPSHDLFVRMDDGRRIVVSQRELGGIREGSRVRISGRSASLL
ncbi:MAG: glycine zipper 2TM domain-containing protein [Xanthomonadales bacterium]|nr:glycine zipper 2TM domain-containing protein [Xanthomonadales bacterium]